MMRYEWKKIFERRLNVVAMLLGYVLIGICVFSYISQESIYDEKTDSYIEGIEAIRMEQARAESQTDVITEEYMTELIREIQDYNMDLESDEAYMEIIRQLGDIFYFAAESYTDMRQNMIDKSALSRIDLTDGAQFYEQRMKKITDYLDCDFSYGNYKEIEKEYWIGKAENNTQNDRINIEFHIPSRGIIGLRNNVLTATAGEAIMAHRFLEYQPWKGDIERRTNGSLIAMEAGTAYAYAIDKLQDRGRFFIFPQDEVYAGQVVGENAKDNDIVVNVTKSKKLSNMRASGADDKAKIVPPVVFSLEEALEYIKEDEYVEVTPHHLRLRKIILDEIERKRANKA